MNYIKLYKGNVTAGGTDGTPVSIGDYTDPIHFDLNATTVGDEQIDTLAVRCDDGICVNGDCLIYDSGDTDDRYKLSINGTSWADEITLGGVSSVNTIFYAKSRTLETEHFKYDRKAKFITECELKRV